MSDERRGDTMAFLFSYGTLQLPEVQQATFGRLLAGRPDTLIGYRLAPVVITDPDVVATSGLEVHTIACPSGDMSGRVPGVVFELTQAELDEADGYETDAYERVEVTLESGGRAFVYVGSQTAE